jgi:hypothetical protein
MASRARDAKRAQAAKDSIEYDRIMDTKQASQLELVNLNNVLFYVPGEALSALREFKVWKVEELDIRHLLNAEDN